MSAKRNRKPITYKQSGVDIDAGEAMVELIKPVVQATHSPRVMGGYGGFAGLFRLDFDQTLFKKNYRDPVLAACTDGVGTKLRIAMLMDRYDTIGTDLVAMNVNDLICGGAEPLFFLDYISTGRLEPQKMADIVSGIARACRQSSCSLLGGETAEMPDFYDPEEFDLAGFAVGVAERNRLIDPASVQVGDVAIALASDGLHSNGFGLARRVLLDVAGYKPTDTPAELEGQSVGQAMLTPTRLYVQPILDVLARYAVKKPIHAMAHITGGGLPGNLPRVLPKGLTIRLKRDSWPAPPIFKLIARKGPVDHLEMYRVFNMGVGFVMIVAPTFAESIMAQLRRSGERCWELGKVKKGGPGLQWT